MSGSDGDELATPREAGRSVLETLEEAILAGLAVIVPFVVTLLVLNAIAGYVFSILDSLVAVLGELGLRPGLATLAVQGLVVVVLFVVVVVVGFLSRFRYGELFLDYVDFAISLVPGVGAIYESFRDMSEVMMETDSQSFREVKVVEFPHEGSYTIGFVTTETPDSIESAVGESAMLTMFLPLAPNPVMGGHLAHIPTDRVYDVDMTVEEGIRAVVTSGVAIADTDDSGVELSQAQMKQIQQARDVFDADASTTSRRHRDEHRDDRLSEYESYAAPDDPTEAGTPAGLRSHRSAGDLGREEGTPDAVSGDHDGALGREDATPGAVEGDADDTLGRDESTPSAVRDDRETPIGRDAAHPGDVENGETDPLGRPAETPADVADAADEGGADRDGEGEDASGDGDDEDDDPPGRWSRFGD